MAPGKPTSLDVAARAGVSQSAVSRVFSGASASPETARKVREAAAALGYRPNVLARSLITGRSRIIGLVVAYLDNQFYPDAIERLSAALQSEGYHLLVFMTRAGDAEIPRVIDELIDYQVDGIVAASVAMDGELASRCKDAGIPVVLFNRGQEGRSLSQVTSANRDGGRRVAEFLLRADHRRFAQITGWQGASTGRDRAAGFRDALAAAGHLPLAETDGLFRRDAAAEAAVEIWRTHAPDAIFVGNDHMAFGVIDALRAEGLAVGTDVSVIGYDDTPPAAWGAYDLTTVRQHGGRMVDATVRLLLAQIEEPGLSPERVEIEGPLVVRSSARLPREEGASARIPKGTR